MITYHVEVLDVTAQPGVVSVVYVPGVDHLVPHPVPTEQVHHGLFLSWLEISELRHPLPNQQEGVGKRETT